MRFWITRNNEVPVREQLVRQVVLGILSHDLAAGERLPSVRALASRHHIHANTVSAAYHDLLVQGWIEARRGSGVYVREREPLPLDSLLVQFLDTARAGGFEPADVLLRLEQMLHPRRYSRVVIVEPSAPLRDILQAELEQHLTVPVEAVAQAGDEPRDGLYVALPTRAAHVRSTLPASAFFLPLRISSVPGSFEGHLKPSPDTIIVIASASPEIRGGARTMLTAVGIDAQSLVEIDAATPGWQQRIATHSLVIADVHAARELPPGCIAEIFRLVSSASLHELCEFCDAR